MGQHFLGQANSRWGLRRALGSATLPTCQQVEANQRRSTYATFRTELETDIHNPPHNWVEGVMAIATSPGDPVFYLHHCWIDMLWARWRLAHPSAAFDASGPRLGLNDPLMEWPDRTPAHVLDHHALGYEYEFEIPRWDSLGGVFQGAGAVLQTGGRLVVFARGTDNAILHRWQTSSNGNWSDWESLGGQSTSDPDAALNAPGGLVDFTRGTDNAIWHAWQDRPNGPWS